MLTLPTYQPCVLHGILLHKGWENYSWSGLHAYMLSAFIPNKLG